MKKFVLGDIHGAFRSLKQVLEKSNFNYEEDKLIFLGDSCDGFSENVECVRELMRIKNLVYIQGNHCYWLIEFLKKNNYELGVWKMNGGQSTIDSFNKISDDERIEILRFLERSVSYHIEDNNLFLHAGYTPEIAIEKQFKENLMWDRDLVEYVYRNRTRDTVDEKYKNIFVGHTPLQSFRFQSDKDSFNPMIPQRWSNVWLMDTGSAYTGCLSIMNIDTEEVFASDKSMELYPDETGRNKFSFNQLKKI